MKASFALTAKTSLIPHLLRNIPAHHVLCNVDCVCRLFRDWIMVLRQDPFIQHKLCLYALDCELSSNCSSMVLMMVSTLTFAFTNVWLKEHECPLVKIEPTCRTTAKLFQCLRIFGRHSHFQTRILRKRNILNQCGSLRALRMFEGSMSHICCVRLFTSSKLNHVSEPCDQRHQHHQLVNDRGNSGRMFVQHLSLIRNSSPNTSQKRQSAADPTPESGSSS